jgi:hypothetical protein
MDLLIHFSTRKISPTAMIAEIKNFPRKRPMKKLTVIFSISDGQGPDLQ